MDFAVRHFAVIKDKEQIRGPKGKKTVISWVRNTSVYRRSGGLVRCTKYCYLGQHVGGR